MAGHIPREFIDDLLTRTDIIDVIHSRVPLKKAGREYKACCPFHNEKTPSFTVSPSKQFYYCFGCGQNGSALSFLMEYEHFSFVEAIESLANSLGLDVPREQGKRGHNQLSAKRSRDLYDLMEEASTYYQLQLKSKPEAIQYLKNRGLDSQTSKTFGIGFSPDSWDAIKSQLSTHYTVPQLLDTGLLIQKEETGKTYDRFRNRIMFPIRDKRGRVIGFGGRVMGDELPKYLNSPETPIFSKGTELYGFYEARKHTRKLERLVVVEGYMDVIALAQFGISYAVATLGTATTAEHISQMFRAVSDIVFCFDGDRAGKDAAWRAMENALPLLKDDKEIRFLFLDEGEDPDTQVRKSGKESFESLLDSAVTLTDYLINTLQTRHNISTREGKAHLLNDAGKLLQTIPESLIKEQLITTMAKLTNVEPNLIKQHKLTAQSDYYADQRIEPRQVSSRLSDREVRLTPVRYAIALLLNEPKLAEYVENPEKIALYPIDGVNFLAKLLEIFEDSPNLTAANLIERFRGSEYEAPLINLTKWRPSTDDITVLQREFQDCLRQIRKKAHENQLESLLHKERVQGLSPQEKNDLMILLSEMH